MKYPGFMLRESWKGLFPFRLECPSWIYPDDILPNVRKMAPLVDSIELILFESENEYNLPGWDQIKELKTIATGEGLDYSIHLPLDVYIGSGDARERETAVVTYQRFVERTLVLDPIGYYVHADGRGRDRDSWQAHVRTGLEEMLASAGGSPGLFMIENLDFPLTELAPLIDDLRMSVVLDTGHCFEYGHDLAGWYAEFKDRVPALHMHAFSAGIAHGPLDTATEMQTAVLRDILGGFKGTVSVEVFKPEYLAQSVDCLKEWMHV